MKNLILLLAILGATAISYAQAPQKFNYQGIARDNTGNPLSGQTLGLRISLMDAATGGSELYVETQNAMTNDYGLYQLQIGDGTVVSGTMGTIDWASNETYIKVEIDPAGGTSYVDLGTTQLLSVPYALYAASGTTGPAGPVGATGPAGPVGPAGPPGPAGSLTGPAGGDLDGNYPNPTIGANKVTASKIAAGAVGASELASNAVTAGKIATNAVTASELASNAVTSAKIANDAVTAAKIDDMGASSGEVIKWNGSNWAPAADNTGGGGGLSGGTSGRILKFTSSTSAGNSSISEDASDIELGSSASPKRILFRGTSSGSYHPFYEGSNYRGYFGSYSGAAADVDFGTGAGSGGKVHLVTQASPKLTVASDGSVGIGTTNPSSLLHLSGGSMQLTHDNPFITFDNTSATSFSGINFEENGLFRTGLHYDPETGDFNITHGSASAGIVLNGYPSYNVGIGTFVPIEKLDVDGNVRAETFISKPEASTTPALQMLRYNSTNDWTLSIAATNNLWFEYNGSLASFINTSGTYSTSDIRLKENIQPLEPVLDKIENIDVMRYQMKADERHLPVIGYIAQDLQKEFPEMVQYAGSEADETNYLGVNYGAMSAVAIKGIQEQQQEIEALKTANLVLQQQIQALTTRLEKLESEK